MKKTPAALREDPTVVLKEDSTVAFQDVTNSTWEKDIIAGLKEGRTTALLEDKTAVLGEDTTPAFKEEKLLFTRRLSFYFARRNKSFLQGDTASTL